MAKMIQRIPEKKQHNSIRISCVAKSLAYNHKLADEYIYSSSAYFKNLGGREWANEEPRTTQKARKQPENKRLGFYKWRLCIVCCRSTGAKVIPVQPVNCLEIRWAWCDTNYRNNNSRYNHRRVQFQSTGLFWLNYFIMRWHFYADQVIS